jgi:large subunit ribosomal protein L6
MVRQDTAQQTVPVPENVTVHVNGRRVNVKGPLGSLEEDLSHLPISLSKQENGVVITTLWPRKRELGMLGTAAAHVRNMFKGVTAGYRYELRGVYAHFPVTVKADEKNREVRIENFTGEKTPRRARIEEGVKVIVKGEDIVVEGTDLLRVSQTAANIQNATKIKKKDQRVFLDGIYVSAKGTLEAAKKAEAEKGKKKGGAK